MSAHTITAPRANTTTSPTAMRLAAALLFVAVLTFSAWRLGDTVAASSARDAETTAHEQAFEDARTSAFDPAYAAAWQSAYAQGAAAGRTEGRAAGARAGNAAPLAQTTTA